MTKMIHRRSLLTGLGAGALALPFVPLLGREAHAEQSQPKRFVVFLTTTGMTGRYPNNWKPSGGESNFTLSPILQPLGGGGTVHGVDIGDLTDDLIITQGIDMEAAYDSPAVGGHPNGIGVLLTATPIMQGDLFSGGGPQTAGWGGGQSIDQRIADEVGQSTAFPSIELGVDQFGGVSHLRHVLSYRAAAQPIPVQSDPYRAFDNIFGNFVASDPEALAIARKRKQSVLDFVRAELHSVKAKISSADRHKMDAHLDAIRSIEQRLNATVAPTCEEPEVAPGLDPDRDNHYPQVGRLQMDLLIAALSCDITRVGSIMWGGAPYGNKFTFLPEMAGDEGLHQLSHSNSGDNMRQDQLEAIARFYARQFAYFVQRLKSIPEGNGTMLDNTVVLWCSEVSRPNNHSRRNMPFVLAGNAGGYFNTGRYLDFGGEPHNKLFVSLGHAFGISDDVFGDPRYGSGPLSGLT